MHQGNDCIYFFNNDQCGWAGDNDYHLLTILGHFQSSATVYPTHTGQAYGYLPGTVFYIFSQEIYLLNFLRQAAQSPLFSPHKVTYFITLYFWFIKYSHIKKNGVLKYKC